MKNNESSFHEESFNLSSIQNFKVLHWNRTAISSMLMFCVSLFNFYSFGDMNILESGLASFLIAGIIFVYGLARRYGFSKRQSKQTSASLVLSDGVLSFSVGGKEEIRAKIDEIYFFQGVAQDCKRHYGYGSQSLLIICFPHYSAKMRFPCGFTEAKYNS